MSYPAFVYALAHEAAALLCQVQIESTTSYHGAKLHEVSASGRKIIFLQTGMGPQRAAAATRYLLENYSVTQILASGYCGALAADLRCGMAFLADRLVSPESEQILVSDEKLLQQAASFFKKEDYARGTLLTMPHPLLAAPEKIKFAEAYQAQAVDMETYAVLKVAAEKKIASLSLRFIIDELGDDLRKVEPILSEESAASPLHLAKELLVHPKILLALPGLQRRAARARKNLTHFVLSFFALKENI